MQLNSTAMAGWLAAGLLAVLANIPALAATAADTAAADAAAAGAAVADAATRPALLPQPAAQRGKRAAVVD